MPTRQIDMRPRTRSRQANPSRITERRRQKGNGWRKGAERKKEKSFILVLEKKTFRIRENGGTSRCTQIRARLHRREASAQKRHEGVRRMRNFPRISRINEKCQIFRRGAESTPFHRLYFLYFTVPPDTSAVEKEDKTANRKQEHSFDILRVS